MKIIKKKELKEIEKEADKILLKDKKCEHKHLYAISYNIVACQDCAKEFNDYFLDEYNRIKDKIVDEISHYFDPMVDVAVETPERRKNAIKDRDYLLSKLNEIIFKLNDKNGI
jgi:hypothetical protein